MHKYLSGGTATWTASTRTISGATMSTAFSADDQAYKRQVFFRIGTTLYYSTVETYVSASSITLRKSGQLPVADGSIVELFLFEYPSTRTFQSYVDKVQSMIKDGASKLTVTDGGDIDLVIAQAVAVYSKDVPLTLRKKIQGTGSDTYALSTILGSLYVHGVTIVDEVECPAGDNPATFLDPDSFDIYDDGTAQDGSNLALRFQDTIPTTNYFTVRFTTQRSVPKVGVQNFPDNDQHFAAITTLAASFACAALAAAYAQSIDKAISVDVVEVEAKTRKYMELSRMYLKQYSSLVFSAEEPSSSVSGAIVDKDVDMADMRGSNFLFHGRSGS